MKPLAIDLFCGLGGWTEGLLAEGYDVVGFDIERRRFCYWYWYWYCSVLIRRMLARMHPSIGDYWVVQHDGYVYLNPKEVFERKYSLIDLA